MDKARDLFDAAVSIARPLREAYVRRQAADDEALMNEVLRLLEFDEPTTEHAGSPGEPGRQSGSLLNADQADRSPVRGYKLTSRQPDWHGGELWLAEPTGSGGGGRVFISLLPRPDSIRAALSRWRLVRPQLDALTAPTIARIVEAGRTIDDRLFLIMPVFLPLTLNDWLLHHKPNAAEMLAVLHRIELALAELAAWGLLHGHVTADSIRLRAGIRGREASEPLAAAEPIVDVQLVGTGLMQILATHTAKGQALSVAGDREGVAEVARRMVGELMHRAEMKNELAARGAPTSLKQDASLRSADLAVRALVAMTGSQMGAKDEPRIATVPGLQSDSVSFHTYFLRAVLPRTGPNKLWGDTVCSVGVAAISAALAGVFALICIVLLMEFGGLSKALLSGNAVLLLVTVCCVCSALANGVMSLARRIRIRQERKSDGGAERS